MPIATPSVGVGPTDQHQFKGCTMDQHCVCGDCTWARDQFTHSSDRQQQAIDTLADHASAISNAHDGDLDSIQYVWRWCTVIPGVDPMISAYDNL